MTITIEQVPASEVEHRVGVRRWQLWHVGRYNRMADGTMTILHSQQCRDELDDLRDCVYSQALENRLDWDTWTGWAEQPVLLDIRGGRLVPAIRLQQDPLFGYNRFP